MREIIHIQVGQCGNQIGQRFWENIASEHGLDKDGKVLPTTPETSKYIHQRLNVYFIEGSSNRWVPRSICCDLEPGTISALKSSSMGSLFKPESLIYGTNGAGNNWAKGFYTEGADLYEQIQKQIQREAEACDQLQGFQITHSLGGGTGSGMGALVIDRVKEDYPDRLVNSFSVFPSPKASAAVVEPYNQALSIHQLIENADQTVVLDNEALENICKNSMKIKTPSYSDMNRLISTTMSGVTCCLRFPGQLNSDLRKLAVNLIPFPRLHFVAASLAPLSSQAAKSYSTKSISELTGQMLDPKNMMCAIDPKAGKYLTGSAIFRGNGLSSKDVEDQMLKVQNQHSENFVEWLPGNIKTTLCDVPAIDNDPSAIFIGNTTSIQFLFRRASEQFSKMFERKAFLHWYTGEGMDEIEFSEAESNIHDLIAEYEEYQEATVEPKNEKASAA